MSVEMGMLTDHGGKRSNIRVLSIMSMLIGGILALAPHCGAHRRVTFRPLLCLLLVVPV